MNPEETLNSTFRKTLSEAEILFHKLLLRASVSWLPLLLTLPAVVNAQFTYTIKNGTITITGYTGSGGAVTIPDSISITNSKGNQQFITNYPVTSIGDFAFYDTTSLTNVTIPNSVTNIGSSTFAYCVHMTNITIDSSATNIGSSAFAYCYGLTAITVDTNNPAYSSVAGVMFDKSQATLIQCPMGKAGSYTIPNGVTDIGNGAFEDCIKLVKIAITNGVTSIGDSAFNGCSSLTNVTVSASVTNIGVKAFANCDLTAITVEPNNPSYCSVNGVLFDQSQTTLIQYPDGLSGNYTIPDGVTSIGDYAFLGCYNLTGVTIPDGVTNIGNHAFEFCIRLGSITIPGSVTSIGDYAFFDSSLKTVTIPDSVASIGDYAFYDCYYLSSVTISGSVISFGDYAFSDCYSLASVYFLGNAPTVDSTVFSSNNNVIVYYLPGTTGWGATFGGLPTALWLPQMQTTDGNFGVRTNQFGFNINWANGQTVVVEACTDLANPEWQPVQTNTLTGGSSYFSDARWTNYPSRFYRLRSP